VLKFGDSSAISEEELLELELLQYQKLNPGMTLSQIMEEDLDWIRKRIALEQVINEIKNEQQQH
jgi:hypothetical protein